MNIRRSGKVSLSIWDVSSQVKVNTKVLVFYQNISNETHESAKR